MTNQDFTDYAQDGSKMYSEQREYIANGQNDENLWRDFTWDFDSTSSVSDGVMTMEQVNRTAWVLRNLSQSTRYRTTEETSDEYRNQLDLNITRDLHGIIAVGLLDDVELVKGPRIFFSPKGGEETSVKHGSNYSLWYLTDQQYDELGEEGSGSYRESRRFMSIARNPTTPAEFWTPFTWE